MKESRTTRRSTGAEALWALVGNLVGVVVIVSLVLAARARSMPAAPPDDPQPNKEIAKLEERRARAGALEAEIEKLKHDARGLADISASRLAERDSLAAAVADAKKQLAERRAALDGETRGQFDLAHELALARDRLAKLDAAEENAKKKPQRVMQVQSYPTPIGHVVDGQELHFQLKGGLICYVPFDELLHKLIAVYRDRVSRLQDNDEMDDTVGPMDGFNLEYSVERQGNAAVPTRFVFEPVSESQGETQAEALGPTSMFRGRLDNLRAEDWTITLWVYPDSFELFRSLRQELYRLGFPIACRPVPEGGSIAASPNGSRSTAE